MTLDELRDSDPKAAWEVMHRFGTKQVEDPWQILGVTPGADWDTISNAHRELAKRFHPDLPEVRNEEIMTLVNVAYRELQRFYAR